MVYNGIRIGKGGAGMSLSAFNMGCNIVAIAKNGRKYGLCVAWAQMLDYDVISVLIGAGSVTGKILEIKDVVGVSALAKDQLGIAKVFGEYHSDEMDKFAGIKTTLIGSSVLIDEAKVMMKCQIIDIQHFNFASADNFVIMKILSYEEDSHKSFLALSDI